MKVTAFQIAEYIDIKRLRKGFIGKELSVNNFEAFYGADNDQFLYVQGYGMVVFSGYSETMMSETIEYLQSFSENALTNKLREDFNIIKSKDLDIIGYNEIQITRVDTGVMRIIMMHVGESVALDYYNEQTDLLLKETNKLISRLELKGNLNISGINLKKFIGKTLNMKNRISDSLYILSSPEEAWEDEYLSKIDIGMQNIFDIKLRHKEIDYKIQTIKENLELFKDMLQHRRSNQLEIIIIALIAFEILNMILDKIFK